MLSVISPDIIKKFFCRKGKVIGIYRNGIFIERGCITRTTEGGCWINGQRLQWDTVINRCKSRIYRVLGE